MLVLVLQLVDQDSGKKSIPDFLETQEIDVRKFGADGALQPHLVTGIRLERLVSADNLLISKYYQYKTWVASLGASKTQEKNSAGHSSQGL